ncbi:hypothetical protein KAU33_04535 [Candidatus Dependentiae bacterium]|nr:hypothetical protein [Candidatus Dependentiae bacterium]
MKDIELPISKKVTRLETEIAIFIPSTQGIKAQRSITEQEMNLRIKSVQRFLSKLCGGFTSFDAQGGYMLNTGQLVDEDVTRVSAFADVDTEKEVEELGEALIAKCKYWANKWGQESIGLEWEGDLYLIPKKI